MQPAQVAVVWMLHDQQQATEARSSRKQAALRPSFTARFGGQFRRFVYRAQLGPVAGRAAA